MPKPGYFQINVHEQTAQQIKEEADKMGLSITEYIDLVIASARSDRILHESIFKGLVLAILQDLTEANKIVYNIHKNAWSGLDSRVGKKLEDPVSVAKYYIKIIQITADLIDEVLQPIQTLLFPLLGSLFPEKVKSYEQGSLLNKMKDNLKLRLSAPSETSAIKELIKLLNNIQTSIIRLHDLFPDDKEIQRLYELLKPYAEKIPNYINQLNEQIN